MSASWKKVLREILGNKSRSLLVVISIAVGVFAVGAIGNSWVVLLNDLNQAYRATNPASAVLSTSPFGDDLIRIIERQPEIEQAEARRSLVVKLEHGAGEQINLALDAVEDFSALSLSKVTPESGTWPPPRREMSLERSWESDLGFEIGDSISIELPDGSTQTLRLAGYAHDLHRAPAGNTQVAQGYISRDTLRSLGLSGSYNRLYLTVAESPLEEDHIRAVVSHIREQVLARSGYTVLGAQVPTPGEQFLTPIIQALLGVLAVVGLFSLLLSAALVLNTISALIRRQIPQIGAMKAIGARRSQITGIYLRLLLLYGVASLLIGGPMAWVGTRAFTGLFARMGNFDILTTQIPLYVLALEALIALLIPAVAGLIPIYFGTRITVREAISDQGMGLKEDPGSWLKRATGWLRVIPGPWALALRNTFRRKGRLALTLLTLSLSGMIFISVISVRESLFASFDQALGYYGYDISIDMSDAYAERRLEREAMRIPGVASAEIWWSTMASRVQGDDELSPDYAVIGLPPETSLLEPVMVQGRWLQPRDRAGIVLNADFLGQEADVELGDVLTLSLGGQEGDWEVVGVVTNQYSGPVIYMPREELGRALAQPQSGNRILLQLEGEEAGRQSQLAARLESRLQRAGFEVGAITTRAEFVQTFEMRFNFLILFLLFLAGLLAFVGGLSLAGTMGLNVMERIREIGVMRAIGAKDGAIRWIVVAEGLAIGLISWLFAAALALPLSRIMSDGVGLAFGGERLLFRFSQPALFFWLALALLIAFIASYLPARDAARKSIREVLSYE